MSRSTKRSIKYLAAMTTLISGLISGQVYASTISDMIQRMGGQSVWSGAKSVHVGAVIHRDQAAVPLILDFWWDYGSPRTLSRLQSNGIDQLFGYCDGAGATHKRQPDGSTEIVAWDQARIDRELTDWHSNLGRLIHRMASADPGYDVKAGEGEWSGWYMVSSQNEPLLNIKVAEDGAPLSFYNYWNDSTVKFQELLDRGDHAFPRQGANNSGTTFDIVSFELSDQAAHLTWSLPDQVQQVHANCY